MSKIIKHITSHIPKQLTGQSLATKRTVIDFAEQYGLVYFGYVSQRSDDHHIVRGMTVSNKHVDDHYCVGTFDGYDVVFVERRDHIHDRDHVWHILEFDLTAEADLPHSFIGSGKHGKGFHELLSTKYPQLLPDVIRSNSLYPSNFQNSFVVYTSPAHATELESIITPAVAEVMASHFTGLVVEITEQALYIYSEKHQLSSGLLDTMLKNGVWLAKSIDLNSRS